MHVEVASRAPHARKYGSTFAESWTCADSATIVAVGAVLAGRDPIVVCDLLRAGARALVTSRNALATALTALDHVVARHAREARDDQLAGTIVFFALEPNGAKVAVAGAGPLHAAVFDGAGTARSLHGHAGALGTGIEPKEVVEHVQLHRDDVLVAATVPIERAWWATAPRTADALLHRSAQHEASAAVVSL